MNKALHLIIYFLFFTHIIIAQNKNQFFPKYVSFNLEKNYPTSCYGFGTTIICKNYWGFSFMINSLNKNSPHTPLDYKPGFTLWGDGIVDDNYSFKSLRLCREFKMKETDLVRFGIEAGPTFVQIHNANFTPKSSGGMLNWGSNYIVNYSKTNSVGLSARAKVAILYSRIGGIEFATNCFITPKKLYANVGITFTFGRVRLKLKKD